MEIISIREQPQYVDQAISYFQDKWGSETTKMLYQDAISRSIGAVNPLPQWYILLVDNEVVGCAGLIANDFISRCELYPWLCALYIEPLLRKQGFATQLIEHVANHAKMFGFTKLHLCTDLDNFYENLGFVFDGLGYHPWGDSSRVYTRNLRDSREDD